MKVTISSKPDKWSHLGVQPFEHLTTQEVVLMHRRTQAVLTALSEEMRDRLADHPTITAKSANPSPHVKPSGFILTNPPAWRMTYTPLP